MVEACDLKVNMKTHGKNLFELSWE